MTSSFILETIASTPWWFYVLVVLVVKLAFIATKPRLVEIKKLFVMPIVFISISILIFAYTYKINPTTIGIWLSTLMAGTLLGFLHFRFLKIKAVKEKAALYFPGSKSLFVLILVLFAARYYFNTHLNIDPQTLLQPATLARLIPLYGFFTGVFIGKAWYALRCVKVGPFIPNQLMV